MYSIVRLLISAVILLAVRILCSAKNRKISFKAVLILFAVIFSFSHIVRFENNLITFSSPRNIWRYKYCNEPEIAILGDESAIVLGEHMAKNVLTTAVRSGDGWKIGNDGNLTVIDHFFVQDILVTLERYSGKRDIFMKVVNTEGLPINIADDYNTEFHELKNSESSVYYGYVPYYEQGYVLYINDAKIVLE